MAEELHFGRAAQRLNVVQPAISQQIKLLEDDLGTHLLERSSRKVALTDAGRAFFAEARRVVHQVEIAEQAARDAVSGLVGKLRIGFVDNAIWSSLPPIIREFRKRFSRADVVLSQMPRGPQLVMLERDELDLAVVPGPLLRPGIASLPLARSPLTVALSKGHRLAAQSEVSIEALAREPFVGLPAVDDPRRINEVIYHLCAEAGFVPTLGQAVDQMHTSLSLISAGLGVGIVPKWICQAWSDNIEYRALLPATEYILLLCYREARTSPMIQSFLSTSADYLREAGLDAASVADGKRA